MKSSICKLVFLVQKKEKEILLISLGRTLQAWSSLDSVSGFYIKIEEKNPYLSPVKL